MRNAQVLKQLQNHRTNWMVGGKRGKFPLQVHHRSVDPDPGLVRVQYFHIHLNLIDWHGKRGAVVDDGMFAEEDDLAGGGGVHEK